MEGRIDLGIELNAMIIFQKELDSNHLYLLLHIQMYMYREEEKQSEVFFPFAILCGALLRSLTRPVCVCVCVCV